MPTPLKPIVHGKFAQINPRKRCRERISVMKRSLIYEHRCRCRRHKCSLECLRRWAEKEKWIMGHFLKRLPSQYQTFRGNLTMPHQASVDEHKQTRSAFTRKVSEYCRVNRATIRFRCYADIESNTDFPDDPTDQHYDFVMWSDVPYDKLKEIISTGWIMSGGLPSSWC